MQKIGFFIDSLDPGGAESLIVRLCEKIRPYRFEPEVFHLGNEWLVKKCREIGVSVSIPPGYPYFKSVYTLPVFSLIFSRFLKRRQVTLLHSHLFGAVTGASLATFLRRMPHVGTVHDTYTIEEKPARIHFFRLAALLGTKLITVSDSMGHWFQKRARFKRGAFETIKNGVDISIYQGPRDARYLARYGIPTKSFIFISVGRLEKIKGFDVLIKAVRRMPSELLRTLVIVGDGPERDPLQILIDGFGLADSVKLLGFRDDVPKLLQNSDCFVLASHSEGLSYSVIEAMAAGLPVVATDVGGNRELVSHEENGFIVPPNDPGSLAEKLISIMQDPVRRRRFGEMSLAFARQRCSIDSTIYQYVNLYKQMLS